MFYQLTHIASFDYFKKEYGENFSFPPHLHNCFECIICLSGEMVVTVDGVDQKIAKGEAVMIFPNQVHALQSTVSRHMLCIFSPKLISAYYNKQLLNKPKDNRFIPREFLCDELNALPDDSSTVSKKGVLYLLCHEFDKTAQYVKSTDKHLLEQIFLFISSRFSDTCTLEALAKEIGYNPSYLSRYFSKSVGLTFNEYVNIYRLNHACYLMENTEKSILYCALESGYNSVRTFNRNFKDRFGFSPKEYKEKLKE